MLRVLLPTNQTCLATSQVSAKCVNTDFCLDKITRGGVTSLVANKFVFGPKKRATCRDFVAKSRTTLCFPQQIFATCNNSNCCNTDLNVASKTHSLHVFVAHFYLTFTGKISNW